MPKDLEWLFPGRPVKKYESATMFPDSTLKVSSLVVSNNTKHEAIVIVAYDHKLKKLVVTLQQTD